jgi:molybdopterin-containing oxidoreductase family iron-sulfur binding subunit
LNVQIYNRCVGTRYCANNCPYQVRFFNFWEPVWPARLRNHLNPDVTVRSRGIMEKCTFCIQRIRRGERTVEGRGGRLLNHEEMRRGNHLPACVQACPSNALSFGDQGLTAEVDPTNPVRQYFADLNQHQEEAQQTTRGYRLLDELGTKPNVIYLKKFDLFPLKKDNNHGP